MSDEQAGFQLEFAHRLKPGIVDHLITLFSYNLLFCYFPIWLDFDRKISRQSEKNLCNRVFLIQNSMEIWYINLRKSLEIQTSLIFSNVLSTVSREQGTN